MLYACTRSQISWVCQAETQTNIFTSGCSVSDETIFLFPVSAAVLVLFVFTPSWVWRKLYIWDVSSDYFEGVGSATTQILNDLPTYNLPHWLCLSSYISYLCLNGNTVTSHFHLWISKDLPECQTFYFLLPFGLSVQWNQFPGGCI